MKVFLYPLKSDEDSKGFDHFSMFGFENFYLFISSLYGF